MLGGADVLLILTDSKSNMNLIFNTLVIIVPLLLLGFIIKTYRTT